ncbi:MAG: sigma-54 dependent transcriptional regulator [Bacteroidota bacterium]|nr:sigma-54 dependent transcriptional regulator [Bacteroidota bacterium]MDP4204451.1 sigma-54 dependent transcriptional regulator [Bacteroidota bacterium]
MRAKGKILVVDDNKSVLSAIELLLAFEYEEVRTLSNPNRLLSLIDEMNPDLILLDMNFSAGVNSGNEGLYWLRKIHESDKDLPVIMITAYGDVELAVNALKEGAVDFVLKPWDNQKLLATIHSALQLRLSRLEVKDLRNKKEILQRELNPGKRLLIGSSSAMMQVYNLIRKVAGTDANVLITGENGTGKELVASEIHHLSSRKSEIMVTVDMGAVTETLFESELFGHVKGAFTDAHEDRSGKIEAANGGTLFLDEIGNLSYALQGKLLAALQNRLITRVGSNRPVPVDVRLICATNRNLEQMVRDGLFREDLLYRINTIHVEVPPLRDRTEDISILADFFLKKYAARYGKRGLQISNQAYEKLLSYQWPGNVRELQHTIEKAVILSETDILKPSDFFFRPAGMSDPAGLPDTIEEMEHQMIAKALKRNDGNLTAAATQLGITRQTLYNKIRKYGL